MKSPRQPSVLLGTLLLGAGVLFLAGAAYWVWNQFRPATRGAVYESRVLEGKTVCFRATAYHEDLHGAYALPGGIHVYEARPSSSADWTPLWECRHDDPYPLHPFAALHPSDDVAALYSDGRYAVTTDAGRTWSYWNAHEKILRVDLTSNGTGTMVTGEEGRFTTLLRTRDWGRSWEPIPLHD